MFSASVFLTAKILVTIAPRFVKPMMSSSGPITGVVSRGISLNTAMMTRSFVSMTPTSLKRNAWNSRSRACKRSMGRSLISVIFLALSVVMLTGITTLPVVSTMNGIVSSTETSSKARITWSPMPVRRPLGSISASGSTGTAAAGGFSASASVSASATAGTTLAGGAG
jgi:hypothetical protein